MRSKDSRARVVHTLGTAYRCCGLWKDVGAAHGTLANSLGSLRKRHKDVKLSHGTSSGLPEALLQREALHQPLEDNSS